jgi:hypothetical protein
LIKIDAAGADGLIAIVLDDDRISKEQAEGHGKNGGAYDVNYIRGTDEIEEFERARKTNYWEWKF